MVKEPEVPDPPPPDELHAVLSVDVQLMVEVEPLAIDDGTAISVTVGLGVVLFVPGPVFVPALCTTVDPFPPPHEARPVIANSMAKMILVRTLDLTVKLFNMIVFLQ